MEPYSAGFDYKEPIEEKSDVKIGVEFSEVEVIFGARLRFTQRQTVEGRGDKSTPRAPKEAPQNLPRGRITSQDSPKSRRRWSQNA